MSNETDTGASGDAASNEQKSADEALAVHIAINQEQPAAAETAETDESSSPHHQLRHWLRTTDEQLEQYLEQFTSNGYRNIDTLAAITKADELEKLGIASTEHQTLLLQAIAQLQTRTQSITAADTTAATDHAGASAVAEVELQQTQAGVDEEASTAVAVAVVVNEQQAQDDEDDYRSKQEQINNYVNTSKHTYPSPTTNTLPQPPKPKPPTSAPPARPTPKAIQLGCCVLRHVRPEFGGNNPVICDRVCLCGTDVCTFISTLCIINLPTAPYVWAMFAYLPQASTALFIVCMLISAICFFFTDFFLIRTNMTDPGILERCAPNAPMYGPFNQFDRFCHTCNIIRPMHAKHCRTCNNCVNGWDHHCPWTGTCVAARNLRYFIGFVSFGGLYGLCAFIVCVVILVVSAPGPAAFVGIVVIGMYGMVIACMLLGMGGNYIWMVGSRTTTNEKIKYGKRLMTDAEKQQEQAAKPSLLNIYYNACCAALPLSNIYE